MKARVNTHAIGTTQIDSTRLGVLGMIAHQMLEAGIFLGNITLNDNERGSFLLEVTDESKNTQVDIDLAKIVQSVGVRSTRSVRYQLRPEGFLMLFVSEGAAGYRVHLETKDAKSKKTNSKIVFDSARLQKNDMFITTLIRPGIWTATDRTNDQEAKIKVRYPVMGKVSYRPSDTAITINVSEKAM